MEKLQNEKLHESYPPSYIDIAITQKQPGVLRTVSRRVSAAHTL